MELPPIQPPQMMPPQQNKDSDTILTERANNALSVLFEKLGKENAVNTLEKLCRMDAKKLKTYSKLL